MRRNLNGGIFLKSLTCMKESVMLRRFIIAIATVAALGISFSSTDASAQKGGGHGHGGGGGGHFGGGGAHFGGARIGGAHFGGARIGGTHFGGARVAGARFGGRYYGGGYRGRYYGGGYGGGYYGDDWGGFAAGAILGGLLAAPYYYGRPYYSGGGVVGYCMQRFKSYDPRSGTYLGYDGYRHPCP
jgi:hypothetical protein